MHIVDSAKRLVKYSWLLQVLVERDLKIRYRRSFLGYLWSVLNPLLMMIILTIVFSNMFRFDIPQYPVYLLAGQLIFGFYSEATSMAMGSILGGAALIKKVYLPKYIFPLSRVISSFTSMLLSMIALFIVIIATDVTFSITIILLPFILVQVLVFCKQVIIIRHFLVTVGNSSCHTSNFYTLKFKKIHHFLLIFFFKIPFLEQGCQKPAFQPLLCAKQHCRHRHRHHLQ